MAFGKFNANGTRFVFSTRGKCYFISFQNQFIRVIPHQLEIKNPIVYGLCYFKISIWLKAQFGFTCSHSNCFRIMITNGDSNKWQWNVSMENLEIQRTVIFCSSSIEYGHFDIMWKLIGFIHDIRIRLSHVKQQFTTQ